MRNNSYYYTLGNICYSSWPAFPSFNPDYHFVFFLENVNTMCLYFNQPLNQGD